MAGWDLEFHDCLRVIKFIQYRSPTLVRWLAQRRSFSFNKYYTNTSKHQPRSCMSCVLPELSPAVCAECDCRSLAEICFAFDHFVWLREKSILPGASALCLQEIQSNFVRAQTFLLCFDIWHWHFEIMVALYHAISKKIVSKVIFYQPRFAVLKIINWFLESRGFY